MYQRTFQNKRDQCVEEENHYAILAITYLYVCAAGF